MAVLGQLTLPQPGHTLHATWLAYSGQAAAAWRSPGPCIHHRYSVVGLCCQWLAHAAVSCDVHDDLAVHLHMGVKHLHMQQVLL